jgi:predicted alpha/beta hydrolase
MVHPLVGVAVQVPPRESLLAGDRSWPIWAIAAAVVLLALAMMSIWLGRHHSLKAKTIWTVIVVLVPILGPVAWFILGRERRRIP